jgi:beta-ureidopropionase / N-carbamoyl-L-amino-acid hydrolase
MPIEPVSPERINSAVEADMHLAAQLFDEMRTKTSDEVGITREPYGPGEQLAIDALLGVAQSLELESEIDPFGNVYMTLPGAQRNTPGWIVGSHIDTVPRGGNFDGLAGVVAGMVAAAAIRSLGSAPRDLTVMAIRAEELSS